MNRRNPPGSRVGQVRAELIRQYRRLRRLRLATIGVVAAALVAMVGLGLGADRWTTDPGYRVLDELAVAPLIADSARDSAAGNRWCIGQCRVRERVWSAGATVADTEAAVTVALSARGWRPSGRDCAPDSPEVARICVQREEFLMDVWIGPADCDTSGCAASTVLAMVRPSTHPAPGSGAIGGL